MIGKIFGFWRVIHPDENRPYHYMCECLKCGTTHSVSKSALKLGKSTMCRACARKNGTRKIHYEIIGKKFGRLTVTGWEIDEKNRTIYTCDCDCENTTTASYNELVVTKKKQSCGCLKSEVNRETIKKTYGPMRETQEKAQIGGTLAYALDAKVSKNNKLGVKGVSKMSNGKYRAYLNLARKHHHLGIYNTLDEAIQARKEGEDKYFKPILDKYKNK